MQTQQNTNDQKCKSKNDQIEEYQCIFYNSPFEWNEILTCSNLKVLIIVGQAITNINGVDQLLQLKELWVIESALEDADAVLKCDKLEKLYLYSNKLREIPYVFVLKNLKILWLSENNISVINNIIQLYELEEINLAGNNITEIGSGLLLCSKLETLNLAGNPISNLLGIFDLKSISSLRKLLFYDPLYCISPITKYINYRSYIIKTLPQLTSLDDFPIYHEESVAVSNYYASKDLYYSIQYHSELYKLSEESIKEKQLLFKNLKNTQDRIFNGMMMLKRKTRSFLEKYNIEDEIKRVQKELSLLYQDKENWMDKYRSDLELRGEKLLLEQKFFGNLKFIDINDNKNILRLLQNILKQSVCPSMSRYVYVKMIQAFQIIDCRTLLKGINSLIGISNGICNKEMDFFILNQPLGVQDSFTAHFEFLNAHFQSKKVGTNKYTVTNSVAIADSYWLNLMGYDSEFCGDEGSRILMLVYTLKNSKSIDSSKNHTTYLNNCEGCNYHFCIENKIAWSAIVPVFVIEYQYKFKIMERGEENLDLSILFGSTEDSDSNFTDVSSNFQEGSVRSFRNIDRSLPLDFKCVLYNCNRYNVDSWNKLTCLDISRSCISSFGSLSQYPNIIHLNVSYNKLSSLFEISILFPKLETLVASYNAIKAVKPIAEMNSLQELDLTSNELKSFINSISWLRKSLKVLCKLKLNYNPFIDIHKSDHMSLIAKRCYPSLMSFNDKKYSEHEITSKILRIDSLASFKQYIISKSITLERNPAKLWNRDNCNQLKKQDESSEDKENFYNVESHVTVDEHERPLCLYICNCEQVYCSIMINLPTTSLKYLTVTQTFINSLIVNNVTNLEELDISFNMIVLVNSTLFSSKKLVRLNLMGNYLTRLNFFNGVSLPSLKYINVSRNFIQCFQGIEHLTTLEEVHMTTNLMNDWNQIRIFKNCTNLKVIDFRGNPIDNMEMAKKFLLFHSLHLKYLNGETITESDLEEASTFFKGILDKDFLLKDYSPEELSSLTQLTVANCSLKQVMIPVLENLTSLNLEHNNLTTYCNLVYLKNLKYLCLSNNHITSFGELPQADEIHPLFNNLQILYLNMNNIKDLVPLELKNAPNLISLFLQDNELSSVQGLNKLENLKHLVLDRNKIRAICPSEVSDLIRLKNLYLEYNLLNCLKFLQALKTLRSLFLAYNKISKYESLQNLCFTNQIKELTFHGNPICRYTSYYAALLSFLPDLHVLDGIQLDRNKLLF